MEAQYLLQEIFSIIILDSNTSMRQSFMGCLLSGKKELVEVILAFFR